MRDDPSQKIIGVSASGFSLKERLGNLRNVIDQNSDEMRIAMIAMQDEQFANQTFMSELCNHKHFFSNQFRPCHRIDFKAPYSTFQCQMTKGGLQEAKTTLHSPPGITQCIVVPCKVTIFHFHIKTGIYRCIKSCTGCEKRKSSVCLPTRRRSTACVTRSTEAWPR